MLSQPQSRVGDSVWIPGRAALPLAWDDEIMFESNQTRFVIPAKQAGGLRELESRA